VKPAPCDDRDRPEWVELNQGNRANWEPMNTRLKIRGIYTTALTKLFVDKGLTIVSPSEVIQARVGNSKKIDPDKPMDVSMDDLDSGQGILLEGHPEPLDVVIQLIKVEFKDAICRKRATDAHHAVIEIEFPYLAKSQMDSLRSRVVPTLFNHHRLRIIASEYVDLIEKEELAYHPGKRETLSQDMEKRLIWDTYRVGKELQIDHVKLNGRVISLSEGEILQIDPGEKRLILKRKRFKGRGKYDGLNVPKEAGDYAITRVEEGDWFYTHNYFRRDGQRIGTYYNINTLVEFYPDRLRYVDLEIDVVCWPDGKTQVIDEQGLNSHWEAGYLSEALKQKAEKTANELKTAAKRGCMEDE
jgi:protein associated with RNAse G/E